MGFDPCIFGFRSGQINHWAEGNQSINHSSNIISERPKSGVIYETCHGHDEPIIFTGHSKNLWVDFIANHNSSGKGFQISFLTIEGRWNYSEAF